MEEVVQELKTAIRKQDRFPLKNKDDQIYFNPFANEKESQTDKNFPDLKLCIRHLKKSDFNLGFFDLENLNKLKNGG